MVAGAVSARCEMPSVAATAANVAEFARLPKVGERCPVSGGSRSWLVETDKSLPPDQKFLIRVRRRGCLRGVVFVSVPKVVSFLQAVQAGAVAEFTAEGVSK